MPGFLGSQHAFQRGIVKPIKDGDTQTLDYLRTRVRPFILRRTKADVAKDLPPKSPWCRRSDFAFFDSVPDVDKVYARVAAAVASGQSFAYISHQWTKDRAKFLEQCRAFAARLKAGGIRMTTYSED